MQSRSKFKPRNLDLWIKFSIELNNYSLETININHNLMFKIKLILSRTEFKMYVDSFNNSRSFWRSTSDNHEEFMKLKWKKEEVIFKKIFRDVYWKETVGVEIIENVFSPQSRFSTFSSGENKLGAVRCWLKPNTPDQRVSR